MQTNKIIAQSMIGYVLGNSGECDCSSQKFLVPHHFLASTLLVLEFFKSDSIIYITSKRK